MLDPARLLNSTVLLILVAALSPRASLAEAPTYDIPLLANLTIDGKSADWGQRGFRAEVMNQRTFDGVTPENFRPRCRLAWTAEGLAVLFVVRDDVPLEQEKPENLWMWDTVQLTVTPDKALGKEMVVVVGPGADPERPGQKVFFPNLKTGETSPTLSIKSSVEKGGYTVEMLYPWSNLSRPLVKGDRLTVSAAVTDIDNKELSMWFAGNSGRLDCVARLAAKPSPPILVVATGTYEHMHDTRVTLCGDGALVGKKVRLFGGKREITRGAMEGRDGRAMAVFTVSMPPVGETWADFHAVVAGRTVVPIPVADARETRGQAFTEQDIAFNPGYAFAGATFPKADFRDPLMAVALIGPYTVSTTFYDKDYRVVSTAAKPGRYGAVVEIKPEKGRVTRRFRTVVRIPDKVSPWSFDVETSLSLPAMLGTLPAAGTPFGEEMRDFASGMAAEGFRSKSQGSLLLAGLIETKDMAPSDRAAYDPEATDRQWWVTMKRRMYGTDAMFPRPFVSPTRGVEPAATVVHEGSLAQTGMTAQGIADVDALLQRWAADSDEAFAVCIVRHGVIALHKAYGTRDGKPMTVTTRSWMASITKLMSASLMLQLVDQGLVDMDAPIRDYLPIMRPIPVAKPITVRNLYTHTGGLWGHWGDSMNDMEEVVADYYPYLAADKLSFYNGAGNSLGSKIIETITGEALPQFWRKHLLDPLGCSNTRAADSSGGTESVPLDMAKFGQMMLNGGSYGDMRFFRRETLERMFPSPLTKQFGEGTTRVSGFGMGWMGGSSKLSEHTMTHGAASSATFCVDFDHDLVVVMCRNSAGKNFDRYFPQFVGAILRAMNSDH